tara:strand:+ start:590870 stop:591658 length:789 start_codon:yes stop_codon:yes gene_type:complete
MKFVIRDDDLNYFSAPEDIDRWYSDIFAQSIPVGFSTIPFVKPTSDVYTAGAKAEEREYSIVNNEKLISYVQNNPLIEILQHGTTHETKGGIYEYQNKDLSRGEARRGREELERAFGIPVPVFVPPHDWISTAGVRAVEAADMNVIRGRGAGLRNFLPRLAYVSVFIRMLLFKLTHILRGKVPAYTKVLDFGKHKEVCSYRLEDTDVFQGLEYAYKKNGIFVVATHVHFYTEEKKERLLRLIHRARELNADFVYPSDLFDSD